MRTSVSATAIQTKIATGPDQMRNAAGTRIGNQGKTMSANSEVGQAGAPRRKSAAMPHPAISTMAHVAAFAGNRPIRVPDADANPIAPSESQAVRAAHSANSNRAAGPGARVKDVKTVDVCDRWR